MSAPDPNLPLLRKVLDHIDAHPDEWVQSSFGRATDCGTAFCVAGHALVMSGYAAKPDPDRGGGALLFHAPTGGGDEVVDPHLHAEGVLGLTEREAVDLFEADNTREEVQEIAERIAERAGETL